MSYSKSAPTILLDDSTVNKLAEICLKELHSIPLYDVNAQRNALAELIQQVQREVARRILAEEESVDSKSIYEKVAMEIL